MRIAKLENNQIILQFNYDPAIVALVKSASYRRYDPDSRLWRLSPDSFSAIRGLLEKNGFVIDPKIDESKNQNNAEIAVENEKLVQVIAQDLQGPLPGPRQLNLRDYQVETIKKLLSLKRAVLAHDMGLGKTIEALVAAKAFNLLYKSSVFVVCPISLRENWLREAEEAQLPIEVFSWAKIPDPPDNSNYVLLADEAHMAQTLKSARTKKLLALAEKSRATFLLSGTPIKNGRPVNLFPLLLACKHPIATNRHNYEQRYCNAGPTRFSQWDTTGATHLAELHEKTADILLRKTKKECLTLPPKTRVFRQVELSANAKDAYQVKFSELRAEYRHRIATGEIESEGAALVLINHLRHAGSIAKIESTVELAEEVLEQGGQPLIFTEFKASAEIIREKLNAELLTGDTPQSDRQLAVDRFQAGASKSFVGTIKAGGLGLNLQAANTVILVDRAWTPGDNIQAEDRAHRIGQNSNVLCIWLQYGDIDGKIDDILITKYERSETVLSGHAAELEHEVSANALAKELLAKIF